IISRLLQRLDILQTKEDGIFPKGSFPTYRTYALKKQRQKADINPFFTGLIGFTLEDLKSEFSPYQHELANKIIHQSFSAYPKFKNRNADRNTYNFWPTDTPRIFTYSGWLNLFNKKRALPDDLDDTVILLMAQRKSDSIAKEVHDLMQGYTNNEEKKISNTFPEYKKIGAYSTWFGKKMPVDFDISVLCNVLYFVQFYNLTWTAADSASLFLIEDMIKTKKHINYSNYVSPHYVTVPNILYHISRLMALKPIPPLEKLKPQLIEDAKVALSTSTVFMDQVILGTSLLRWGVKPPVINLGNSSDTKFINMVEDEKFCFFIASMASMLPDSWKKRMTKLKIGTFYYYCPAYNHLLLLEHLVLNKKHSMLQ
ncbi:MAG: hypothetical protein ACK4S0_13125, partial [Sediminibacterium sp.]